MSFEGRREFLFMYSVVDANPNGDPLNQNHPRYDEDTEQVMVSDVRIKRTLRDQWVREKKLVFVDGESKTLKSRFEELRTITGKNTGREVLGDCLDTRLFGVTFALGNDSFAWTGPVQIKWGRSLHAAKFEFIQGTAAFATKDDSQQRSFRNEYKVPFALVAVYGIANQYAAKFTGADDNDLEDLREALWSGTNNLITRSKNEHKARFSLEIEYKPGFDGKIGALDEKVSLLSLDGSSFNRDEQKALRRLNQLQISLNELIKAIIEYRQYIAKVSVSIDPELKVIEEEKFKELDFVTWEMR